MNLIKDYEKLIANSINKYGDLGLGTLIVRIQYLMYLIKENSELTDVIKNVLHKIIIQYNSERIPPATLAQYIDKKCDENTMYYIFSKEYFDKVYGGAFPEASNNIYTVTKDNVLKFADSQWYLYVIDENDNLLIYDSKLSTAELILNRNDKLINNVPIVHPILSYASNLKVKAAGEISFLHDGQKMQGVIINSKSGHYRPNSSCLELVSNVITNCLSLSSNKIFRIPIGADVMLMDQ